MRYIVSASTDAGKRKPINEDSLSAYVLNTQQGRMVFAVLCDGMGGLAKGEVASASLIHAFTKWMNISLPILSRRPIEDTDIRAQWNGIVMRLNVKMREVSNREGFAMGTTVAVALFTERRYYVMNVGDSRVYEIAGGIRQITCDQTVVAREAALGYITQQEAKNSARRHVLLQCVGASPTVIPDYFFGETQQNAVYMLCSDGFCNEITAEEIFSAMAPGRMTSEQEMKRNAEMLICANKERNEQDNISVITISTMM
ncbi:MAG: protein phosphatase 2C domain-containing protein [Oscillospiraceae bacterium]|nr:protein phosphatase 2C domain-containing protein [Oscillospiraceae bacterium]